MPLAGGVCAGAVLTDELGLPRAAAEGPDVAERRTSGRANNLEDGCVDAAVTGEQPYCNPARIRSPVVAGAGAGDTAPADYHSHSHGAPRKD